jgi:hypothetical protein
MPVVQTVKVYRGEDIELYFTMTPKVDITGWVLSLTVANAYNNQNKTFQVTGIITSGPNGEFHFIIPSATLDIAPKTYAYDVFRTSPSRKLLSVGNFIISEDARYPQ